MIIEVHASRRSRGDVDKQSNFPPEPSRMRALAALLAIAASALIAYHAVAPHAHRALADVRESVDYLRYYRECGFVGARRFA